MAANFCPSCGAPLLAEPDARFCANCGRAAGGAPPPTQNYGQGYDQNYGQSYGQAVAGEDLSLFEYFVKCLKNYANFRGRARRKEFWSFVLFNVIFSTVLSVLDKVSFDLSIFGTIYSVLMLLPNLAVAARRLHDIGRSGWYYPLWLVFVTFCYVFGIVLLADLNGAGLFCLALAFAACIVCLVVMAMKGDAGENRFGPSPKGPVSAS